MKKRLLAFLLSLAMVAGMLPMSAMEAKAAETDETIVADNVTGNSFTDTTANPGESYVYTIEGSDGSVQEIKVLAEGEEGTGNSITTEGENWFEDGLSGNISKDGNRTITFKLPALNDDKLFIKVLGSEYEIKKVLGK